jgi:hypothetical protein
MTDQKLPPYFRDYFWDVNFDTLTLENAPNLILKRVLDRGNTDAILWMRKHYTNDQIRELLSMSRDISQKTASFWANILKMDYNEVRCLQMPYSPIQWGLSS